MFSVFVLTIGILLGITTLLGIVGNFCVCLVVCWNRSLKTQINMLLTNLALADIGMSASCMPFAVATVFLHEEHISDRFCHFNGFINTLFTIASVLIICAICIYHFCTVVLPLDKVLTNFRCLVMILSAWIIAILLAVGPLVHWGRYEFTSNIFNCQQQPVNSTVERTYAATLVACGFVFPLLLMTAAYCRVFSALKAHRTRMEQHTSIGRDTPTSGIVVSMETKMGMMIGVVFLIFLICRTPFLVYLMYIVIGNHPAPDFLGQLAFWAIYLHSACDPFIYAFKVGEFKETIKEIVTSTVLGVKAICHCDVVQGELHSPRK